MNRYSYLAPVILRIGLSLVFLWFGWQQIFHSTMWTRLVPAYAVNLSHLDSLTLVHLNGAFEIVFGIALFIGLYTSLTSFLLALHLIDIISVVGYGAIGARDFGLCIAMISLSVYGASRFSLDSYIARRKNVKISSASSNDLK